MRKMMMLIAAVAAMLGADAGDVTATAVTVRQGYPLNGLVDIEVTIAGASNDVAKSECTFAATNNMTGAALSVAHITRVGTADTGSGTTWMRKFVWDTNADLGEVKFDDIVLVVEAEIPGLGGVQLWENGPYWAECNVGATKPEEYGYYFWWSDTVGYTRSGGTWTSDHYSDVTWVSSTGMNMDNSPFSSSSCPTYGKDESQLQSEGYIDSTGNLVAAHDAATVHLGVPWRMPTEAEFSALISNCMTTWTTTNGVFGRLVTGKGDFATKSIFLPAAGFGYGAYLYGIGSDGYYWSSTPDSDHSNYAWCLDCNSSNFGRNYYYRYGGQSVRPVRGFAK